MTLDSSMLLALAGLGVLALLAAVLGVALVRSRRRTRRELEQARAETADLRRQLDQIERILGTPAPRTPPRAEPEYTITDLGRAETGPAAPADPAAPAEIDRALFADLVLRESVVRVASFAHGLRRALGAESRNRIRFEVRREVRRARKQRKADTRVAVREWEARQRAAMTDAMPEAAGSTS